MNKSDQSRLLPLSVGVDDIASGSASVKGYTYFCLPEIEKDAFDSQAQSILDLHRKPKSFHGKSFSAKNSTAYKEFLQLIKTFSGKSLQAKAVNILFSATYLGELTLQSQSLLEKAFEPTTLDEKMAASVLTPYFVPLYAFARSSQDLGENLFATYYLDRHSSLSSLDRPLDGSSIQTSKLIQVVYNKYVEEKNFRKHHAWENLELWYFRTIAIRFWYKLLIYWAISSLADIFVQLGHETNGRLAKSKLLRDVFGDIIDKENLGDLKIESNDISIPKDQSLIKFELKWHCHESPGAM